MYRMTRGKSLVEMLRFSSDLPHGNRVRLESGQDIFRYDPDKSRSTKMIVRGEGDENDWQVSPASDAGEVPVSGWIEMELSPKKRGIVDLGRAGLKVSRLANKRVKGEGKIPRLTKARALFPRIMRIEEPAQVEPQPIQRPSQAGEIPTFPKPAAVKVVPTPVRRKPRMPKMETEPVAPSRPLKVIRRRGEQAPKVFETSAKIVPQAMLEGIAVEPDEKAESRHE